MTGDRWTLLVLSVSLCTTAAATPAPTAPPAPGAKQEAGRGPGEVFQDCDVCAEMVVMPGRELWVGTR